MYSRKKKAFKNAIDQPFSLDTALDALADTYNGVSRVSSLMFDLDLLLLSLSFGPC